MRRSPTRHRRAFITTAAALFLCALPGLAAAQNGADKAAADTLFGEGKKLIAAGDTEAACAKFEASLSKVRQLGAQLALASCYEKLGHTASAWGEFRAAASAAARARDPQRKRFAEEHARALEERLSRLVIRVEPGYRIDGLQVKRNGVEVESAELGTPVPVDPGEYAIEALAPGWVAWTTTVTVTMPGTVEVMVPALGKAPIRVEEPVAPPRPTEDAEEPAAQSGKGARRTAAYAVGGGGVAVVAVSLILGSVASSRWSEAQDHCEANRCDQTGVDLADSASTMGTLSTVTFIAGTAAVAAGAYLWFTSRSEETPPRSPPATALRLFPAVGPAQTGLLLQGGF